MLSLTRKIGEAIYINGTQIKITVSEVYRHKVRLLIEAPPHVSIEREERLKQPVIDDNGAK